MGFSVTPHRVRAPAVLWPIVFLTACVPDLDRFTVVEGIGGEDGGSDEPWSHDSGSVPGVRDGGGPGGDDGGATAGCPLPHLLVSVENVSGSGGGGRIVRLPLDGSGACAPLTGDDGLPAQPLAVGWYPPDGVIAATRDGIYLLGSDDSVRMVTAFTSDRLPIDTFPIEQAGELRVAVGYRHTGSADDQIGVIELYDPIDGTLRHSWNPPFGTFGATQDHAHPDRLLIVRPGNYGAAEVDPFADAVITDPVLVPDRGDVSLRSLHALPGDGDARLVWTGTRYTDDETRVYFRLATGGIGGPISCSGRTCEYTHAVADPTNNIGYLALCERPGTYTRDVLRFEAMSDECEVLLDGDDLGPQTRASKLAVAVP